MHRMHTGVGLYTRRFPVSLQIGNTEIDRLLLVNFVQVQYMYNTGIQVPIRSTSTVSVLGAVIRTYRYTCTSIQYEYVPTFVQIQYKYSIPVLHVTENGKVFRLVNSLLG